MYTKEPWEVNDRQVIAKNVVGGLQCVGNGDVVIATTDTGYFDGSLEEEANARRICTCVNSHDALLEACKHTKDELAGQLECGLLQISNEPRYWQQLIGVLEAAIASAEGRE